MTTTLELNQNIENGAILKWVNPKYRFYLTEVHFPQDTDKDHIKKGTLYDLNGNKKLVYVKFYGTSSNYKDDEVEREVYGYHKATEASIPIPELIAFGVDANGRDFLVLEDLFDTQLIHECLSPLDKTTEKIIKNLATSLYSLYLSGILHNDTDSVNILVRGDSVYLIDFAQCQEIDPSSRAFPLNQIFIAISSSAMRGETFCTRQHIDWAKSIVIEELARIGANFE